MNVPGLMSCPNYCPEEVLSCSSCRESASMATGHFSWRAAPTGTLPASGHPSLASPALAPAARGPWAHTSKARARLAGLSFGAGQPTPAMQVRSTHICLLPHDCYDASGLLLHLLLSLRMSPPMQQGHCVGSLEGSHSCVKSGIETKLALAHPCFPDECRKGWVLGMPPPIANLPAC